LLARRHLLPRCWFVTKEKAIIKKTILHSSQIKKREGHGCMKFRRGDKTKGKSRQALNLLDSFKENNSYDRLLFVEGREFKVS
jgi:hypothetical protein